MCHSTMNHILSFSVFTVTTSLSLQRYYASPPSLSLLYFLYWASSRLTLWMFSFSRFCKVSACWQHNFAMISYRYGILKTEDRCWASLTWLPAHWYWYWYELVQSLFFPTLRHYSRSELSRPINTLRLASCSPTKCLNRIHNFRS